MGFFFNLLFLCGCGLFQWVVVGCNNCGLILVVVVIAVRGGWVDFGFGDWWWSVDFGFLDMVVGG